MVKEMDRKEEEKAQGLEGSFGAGFFVVTPAGRVSDFHFPSSRQMMVSRTIQAAAVSCIGYTCRMCLVRVVER